MLSAHFLVALILPILFVPSHAAVLGSRSSLPATNAERLRRGLPLKPPVRRSTALSPRQSGGSSSSQLTGYFTVADATSKALGYLSCVASCKLVSPSAAASATLFRFLPSSTPFNLVYSGGTYGAAGGYLPSGDIRAGSATWINFDSVYTTQPFAHAVNSTSSSVQSAIWTYSAENGTLTPQWVNSDTSKPPTYIVAYTSTGDLYFTGDVGAFQDTFGKTSTSGPLTLEFAQNI